MIKTYYFIWNKDTKHYDEVFDRAFPNYIHSLKVIDSKLLLTDARTGETGNIYLYFEEVMECERI